MGRIEVEAEISGRADGPPVVLSNSLGSTRMMWDPQLPALEERFRVIRYDTRGHGFSPVPDGPYTIDDLADDLIGVLDRFDIERAHLVGLSLGGMTAMRVAARNPERVDRLALLCTATRIPPAANWTERAEIVRNRGVAAVAPAVIERWFTADYRAGHAEELAAYTAMIAATPAEGYAGCCEAIAKLDLREDLAAITAPTLAIAGANDPSTPPACLAEIADGVVNGRLLEVLNAAHLANAEQPGVVTPALIEHLEQS